MKRFTETTKWNDEWFQDLPLKYKVFWQYLLDNCDAAGVWKCNFKLASFQIGERFELGEILMQFKGRVEDIGKGRLWIVKFCDFQYGRLSENCRPHCSIISILENHGLADRVFKGYPKGIHTLQEKEQEQEQEKERGMQGGKPYSPPFEEFWEAYPRKEGKGGAWNVWKTLKPPPDTPVLLDAIARYAATEQWRELGGKFIPHPRTWLNQRRWEDAPGQRLLDGWDEGVVSAEDEDRRMGVRRPSGYHQRGKEAK